MVLFCEKGMVAGVMGLFLRSIACFSEGWRFRTYPDKFLRYMQYFRKT